MKIALVHYHLKTGGVTTVLRQQAAAIQKYDECLVLTGDRASAELPCKVVQIPAIGYDRAGLKTGRPNADEIAGRVLEALKAHWPAGCDVMHIHNPTLAKNRQFINIIKRLQQAGVNLFLQIHDFAEDGRPGAYNAEAYPADCHYGVINTRDADILKQAGLREAGLHYLPNPIDPLAVDASGHRKPQILYPVRAIRRKNLGEAVLLSLFFKPDHRLAITQPPNSPADAASYRDWVRWVKANRLPVDVAVGRSVPFTRLVSQADSMITTSVAEGFGFSFLEPWTAGKWLWGRRIADVCDDFTRNGIRLDFLYDRLDVPLDWIDTRAWSRRWHCAVYAASAGFGHALDTARVNRAFSRLREREHIDLGLLDETSQRRVGERLLAGASARETLVALNPWLKDPGAAPDPSGTIAHNRQAVLTRYGVDAYRTRLVETYDRVIRHRVRHCIDKKAVIGAFFNLDRFPLLKWSAYGC